MVDINKWYDCKKENPKRKGKYTLMIGRKNLIGKWLDIGVMNIYWNGRNWKLPGDYIAMKWTYLKPEDHDKYPNFEEIFGGK